MNPGLKVLSEVILKKKRLTFATGINEGIEGSEVIFIAVGTPPGEDGSADLNHVLNVAKEIGQIIKQHVVVVTKSTVPVVPLKRFVVPFRLKSRNDMNLCHSIWHLIRSFLRRSCN